MIYDLQKASLWKRISAFLFDFILLGIASVLFAWLLSMALGYNGAQQRLEDQYTRFSQQYGSDLKMSLDEYQALDEEDLARMDEAYAAMGADDQAMKAYSMVMWLSILIISFGILLGCLSLEFFVPLKMGNGMTLGKRIFGLAVMHTEGIRLGTVALFVRTVLGKFAIEIMIPVILMLMVFWGSIGVMGPIILFLILAVQAAVMLTTRTNALIHDLLAGTVVVDFASQMIFDTREDMIRYKEQLAAEKAQQEQY